MTPDLFSWSGREGSSVADRIGMLRADLMYAPFNGITDTTRAATQAIHDIKLTVGAVRSVIELYDAALVRGVTEDKLAKGADGILSDIECWILAWRRGGHPEYEKVRRFQWKRGNRPKKPY